MIKKLFDKKYDLIIFFLLLISAVLMIFRYGVSIYRTVYAVRDLGVSVAYYFCMLFGNEISVTVTELPSADIMNYLPASAEEMIRKLRDMWSVIFDGKCFLSYISAVLESLDTLSIIILAFLPFFIFLPALLKNLLLSENDNDHGDRSRLVVRFEKRILPFCRTVKRHVLCFWSRFVSLKVLFIIFIAVWLVNFNVLTIVFEFLAYYFYFAFSFDLINLPIQLVKLILDVIIMLSGAPLLFWLAVAYLIIVKVRKSIGYTRLEYRENLDRSFIDSQPLIMMFTGTMGTGKTTALTSVGLSVEIMFRNKALELMLELDSKYPNFPWIKLEDWIHRCIAHKRIYNLTTCRDCVDTKRKSFFKNSISRKIFGYSIDLYRTSFDDELTYKNIWESIEDYACLYFIYIIESSLIVSNYSVRTDCSLSSVGNFPLWSADLFRSSPEISAYRGRRSHILDYDILRLGMQVLKDNPRKGSFEFGVILMSEFAKERGNQLTLQGLKKDDVNTNQKNDLFSYSLKMCRHKATICGYPFVRFVSDEQREDSLNADTRELMSIIHIEKKRPKELLVPMFFVEELLHDLIYPKFVALYTEYRYSRGDTCLLIYLLHNCMSAFHNYYRRMSNLFGCNILNVSVESEGMEPEKASIHLLHKKVYSDRFSTDCYRGFSEPALRKSKIGLDDYLEYKSSVATLDELHYQNSYFIRDLENIQLGKEKENE